MTAGTPGRDPAHVPSDPPAHGNGLSVTGPGGWGLQASGRELVFLVILLAGLGGNAWILREGFRAIVTSNEALRGEFRSDHQAQRDSAQALVCILSVPAEDRTTAFRSGDPCAWVLSSGTGLPPARPPPRERETGERRSR
jgi:hypothetical protein